MSKFNLDKWSTETTKWLATMHHGDRVCEQQGVCTCGRQITMQKLQYQMAVLMTEYEEANTVNTLLDLLAPFGVVLQADAVGVWTVTLHDWGHAHFTDPDKRRALELAWAAVEEERKKE